uniref:Calcium uniporter protein n=1 Tax=Crassostrea virginica TaxID=6565 RepID=A0A8B8CHZ3_CRAVI|nr:calcium uniporter protein, mitochondrial-like [Crassostrea virginica]
MASARLLCVVRQDFYQQFNGLVKGNFLRKQQIKSLICPCSFYSTQTKDSSGASVEVRDGLSVFTVPLPSRNENCEFTLKPVSQTVGDLLSYMREEDGGIDRAAVYTDDGIRISKSTTIDVLLRHGFKLVVNSTEYDVKAPQGFHPPTSEDIQELSNAKNLIAHLYSTMNVEQHQIEQEKELLQKLEHLKTELAPMEEKMQKLNELAKRRTTVLSWAGLAAMGVQFGFLARLTWWDYSWDIMEPVTYFVTYGTTMAMFAYFVLTKQEYNFVEVKDRQHLLSLHSNAKKEGLDISKYNALKENLAKLEYDIKRLRDPLQLHVPMLNPSKEKKD